MIVESVSEGETEADAPEAQPNVLDASTLKPDESLAGRDLSGMTLKGDFSGRTFDDCVMRRVVARHANFKGASMRRVDASRGDFRGACLVGVAAHGMSLRRAKADYARMAGMFSPYANKAPEFKALEDGEMPPMEPLDEMGEEAQTWAKEKVKPVDAAKEAEEDAKDAEALQSCKKDKTKILDMRRMSAK